MSEVRRVNRDPREPRIEVPLGGVIHCLTIEGATEFRDALTRELGAPQVLTDREAMVWSAVVAAETRESLYVDDLLESVSMAGRVVRALRELTADDVSSLCAGDREMLAVMTGGGK